MNKFGLPVLALAGLTTYDLLQKRRSILRTFPVVGHLRYAVEAIGPELRQYIVTDNNTERPFNRDQRRWIYASAKLENNYFGFGTDNNIDGIDGYPIIKARTFSDLPARPHSPQAYLPSAKVLGGPRDRRAAFRPQSVVNISAMSYGSLSAPAIEALNAGAALAGALHNTGEGGLSDHHRHGGDLVYQIGTGYFGCRTPDGTFSLPALLETIADAPVRAIEIKLSQGAKPGLGGILPGAKVTDEIARIRGIEPGRDCASPARHTAFGDVDSLLDFVETIADATGLPVGIKSAVGHLQFWEDLADAMATGTRGVDFITVDGGEGGTGAAPLAFTDHVSYPLHTALPLVQKIFQKAGIAENITWIASGRTGLPDTALMAFAAGADMVNVAREAMLSIGCIQAQRCHTGHCPTGVATQNAWLMRGVDPTSKSARAANYLTALRRDLLKLSDALAVAHPALATSDDIDILHTDGTITPLTETIGYQSGWGTPSPADRTEITRIMYAQAQP
ncbi:FMN-binding glutamate synthase family protein [Rhodococcus sp. HM1]|uniref:FMN-binding glutamate synthase family protein n=1 Tax=unclassified Rhodococcus (in: high G+C Gram-positive bacteria) TaxID=192944 RepID=UPI0018CE63A5|nr:MULTISPECIES: FMN-binding glutamate synthase family protein [unclassified Rhodococcus (in: high G+C Gram-positive bacteria)]MBH0121725.1 FMN-binding glutamate synthase family protein [Rhodococcus sp. CX]MCK8673737.1 FMN-binding glutamate synthase family protein [Rhodococcus sp. HM1]